MMFRKLGLINKSQKGVTMIELLAVFAVTSIISGGITMSFYQVVTGSASANNHMTAVRQVQNAGYWISYDAQLTQKPPVIVKDGGQLVSITLTWTDWDNKVNQAVYNFENMSVGTLKQLKRTHSRTGDTPQTAIIAQFIDIDPAKTDCVFADADGDGTNDTLILKVTAVVGSGLPETREYRIVPRPL